MDNRKDPGLSFLSAVGTDTQVDLLGVGVGLVGSSEGKDDILGSAGDVFENGGYVF